MSTKRKKRAFTLLLISALLFALGVAFSLSRDISFVSIVYKAMLNCSDSEKSFCIKLMGEIALENVIMLFFGVSVICAFVALFSRKESKKARYVSVFCMCVPLIYEVIKSISIFSRSNGSIWSLLISVLFVALLSLAAWFIFKRCINKNTELYYILVFFIVGFFARAVPATEIESFYYDSVSFFRAEWVEILFFACGAFVSTALLLLEKKQEPLDNKEISFSKAEADTYNKVKAKRLKAISITLIALFLVASLFELLATRSEIYFVYNSVFLLGVVLFTIYLLKGKGESLLLASICLMETRLCLPVYYIYEKSLYVSLASFNDINFVALALSLVTVASLLVLTALTFKTKAGKMTVVPIILAIATTELTSVTPWSPLCSVVAVALLLALLEGKCKKTSTAQNKSTKNSV